MKNALLILFPIFWATAVFCQHDHDFQRIHPCSNAKITQARLKSTQQIIQSPLLFHYDVTFYHLNLEVSDQTTFISGDVTIYAQVITEVLDTIVIELIDQMIIDSIKFNASVASFFRSNDEVFIPLTQSLQLGKSFNIQIFYHGTPPTGNFFNGVTTAYDSQWNKHVTWTLSEPFNARQWWPVKQVLEDKADSVWVFLTTESKNKAGSNGLLTNVVHLPDNKVMYEWKSKYPIAYYLISFAVAEYQDYSIYAKPGALNNDSILIQHFIYNSQGCLDFYKVGLNRTAELVELFSDLYSLYPFHEEKYGHCLAMISGGMEHQTMTTINNFGTLLVSHELGHSWFGNNVTCATWSDIWVNEGFATYTDYLAHEKISGGQWPSIWMKNVHEYITSKPDGSVYVPPGEIAYNNVERIFDSRLTYYKGALILHMIRYELNDDDLFFQVFKNYQALFADSVAVADDFIAVLNETTNQDFTLFFEQWYYGEGHPILSVNWHQSDYIFEISSAQTTSAPDVTPLFNMKYPVRLFLGNETDTIIEVQHDQPLVSKTIELSSPVDSIQVDPDLWVLKKVVSINGVGDQLTQPEIEVFPNPVRDFVFIRTNFNETYRIVLSDMKGTMIFSLQTDDKNPELDLSRLKTGIYLISIEFEGQKHISKIIKY